MSTHTIKWKLQHQAGETQYNKNAIISLDVVKWTQIPPPVYVSTTYSIVLAFLQQICELNINIILAMKVGPMGCPETSVRKNHYTLLIITRERRSHLHRVGSLKSRDVKFTFTKKHGEGKLCITLADFQVRTFTLPACYLKSQRLPNTQF